MTTKSNYKHSKIDDIDDSAIDAMIAQTGPMQPIEIARFVGLTNTRVIQILEGAQAKAIRALSRRGFNASNIDDLFSEGGMDTSYWKAR